VKICICAYCEKRLSCKGCLKNCQLCGRSTMRCKENYVLVDYGDGVLGIVQGSLLDELIEKGEIKKFYRSDGWVTIGTDSLRTRKDHYNGIEKRRSSKKK
jgi:hypothetical protein